jgi:hypothetical protein
VIGVELFGVCIPDLRAAVPYRHEDEERVVAADAILAADDRLVLV